MSCLSRHVFVPATMSLGFFFALDSACARHWPNARTSSRSNLRAGERGVRPGALLLPRTARRAAFLVLRPARPCAAGARKRRGGGASPPSATAIFARAAHDCQRPGSNRRAASMQCLRSGRLHTQQGTRSDVGRAPKHLVLVPVLVVLVVWIHSSIPLWARRGRTQPTPSNPRSCQLDVHAPTDGGGSGTPPHLVQSSRLPASPPPSWVPWADRHLGHLTRGYECLSTATQLAGLQPPTGARIARALPGKQEVAVGTELLGRQVRTEACLSSRQLRHEYEYMEYPWKRGTRRAPTAPRALVVLYAPLALAGTKSACICLSSVRERRLRLPSACVPSNLPSGVG